MTAVNSLLKPTWCWITRDDFACVKRLLMYTAADVDVVSQMLCVVYNAHQTLVAIVTDYTLLAFNVCFQQLK